MSQQEVVEIAKASSGDDGFACHGQDRRSRRAPRRLAVKAASTRLVPCKKMVHAHRVESFLL